MNTIMSFTLHVAIHIICYQSNYVLWLGNYEASKNLERPEDQAQKRGESTLLLIKVHEVLEGLRAGWSFELENKARAG